MASELVQTGLVNVAGPTLVAAVTAIGSFAAGRQSGKASFINAVQAAAKEVIDTLRGEVARLTTRCEAAESAHKDCEARVTELWEAVKGKPIPPYVPGEPRGGAPED